MTKQTKTSIVITLIILITLLLITSCPDEPVTYEPACDSPAMTCNFTGDDLFELTLCNEENENYFAEVTAANYEVLYLDFSEITINPGDVQGTINDAESGDEIMNFDVTVDTGSTTDCYNGTTTFGGDTLTWDSFTRTALQIHYDDVGILVEGAGDTTFDATRIDGNLPVGIDTNVYIRFYLYEDNSLPTIIGWMNYDAIGYVSKIQRSIINLTALGQDHAAIVAAHAVLGEWEQNSGIDLHP